MFKMKAIVILVLALLSVTLVVNAQTDDGRMNPPNYHFGGDALYCEANAGCHVLDQHGVLLLTWDQASIDAAVQQSMDSNQNVLVSEQQATYGLMGLWVQYVEVNKDNSETWHLCLQGYDEWGKQNSMCFKASHDGYQPVRVPPPATVTVVDPKSPVADCSAFKVSDAVDLIADPSTWGYITAINTSAGTLTFSNIGLHIPDTTVSCDKVELIIL